MDFKKFANDAGTFLSRAKQYTEEKLGQAEKTEYDAHFESLLARADNTRLFTERLLEHSKGVLQPNPNKPSIRLEETVFDKLDRKKRDHVTNHETLGQTMLDAGNEFGPGTSYGSALVKCGHTEMKLGQAEREMIQAGCNNFVQPIKAFIEGDLKTVQKERKILEAKRLDLDTCKSRMKRAKSLNAKDERTGEPVLEFESSVLGIQENEVLAKAEADLRVAQAEFDRQQEITKLLLEGISSTHAHHLRCLHDFIECQTNYHAQCHQYMVDLQKQLGSFSSVSSHPSGLSNSSGGGTKSLSPTIHPHGTPAWQDKAASATSPTAPPTHLNGSEGAAESASAGGTVGRSARVLYDYDAADIKELSLIADEVITVFMLPDTNDWVIAQRGSQKGRVPVTYLEIF